MDSTVVKKRLFHFVNLGNGSILYENVVPSLNAGPPGWFPLEVLMYIRFLDDYAVSYSSSGCSFPPEWPRWLGSPPLSCRTIVTYITFCFTSFHYGLLGQPCIMEQVLILFFRLKWRKMTQVLTLFFFFYHYGSYSSC